MMSILCVKYLFLSPLRLQGILYAGANASEFLKLKTFLFYQVSCYLILLIQKYFLYKRIMLKIYRGLRDQNLKFD